MTKPAIALLALVAVAGCQAEKTEAPPPVRPVLTTRVEVRTAETFGPFAGTVEPRYQTQGGFRVPGRMVARDVYVGDLVPKGARLAALDPTVLQFAVTRARADVTDAEAQLANASAVEARQRTLFEGGNVTQAALDGAVASRDTAAARLAQGKAALQKATDELGYATLKADVDGVVTAWNAEIGQVVSAGQAVVTLARPDIREAVVDIPDGLMAGIEAGTAFTVTLQAAPTITAGGRVREIGPLADPATRTRRVRMTLVDPPEAFRLGTTVTVALERPTSPRITLPATALLRAENRTSVWVVAPDGRSVARRDVTLVAGGGPAERDGATVTLSDGVSAGETVVVAGVHSLADGQAVRLAASGL
ncbi:efflux RND transporter periplasmic adaptor subunit [Methylobacterium platani]|uniref:Efflux transporter periplasmic adaptor subunit n=2 Tax=Methylobacterium platani TaxID=427683 RepID=A0A179S199_9HYPH|nr:efflux RND transporter periplasmic adaptor subunit [Methylobacterium platani]KMO15031.1 RND transporter [Methylobacterium platani JCM 14648]OAS16840.1 efflux transporter periplasmic adaptor subunit [Methylobacterium platani]